MKKILIPMLMMILLAFLLAGCASSTPSPTPSTTTPAATSPVSTTPVSTTTAVSSPTTSPTPSVVTPAPGTPKYGGTFKFADPRGPSTTLGWFAEAGAQGGMWSYPVLETLLECDVNGKFSPMLATSWEVSPDLKSITLKLRKGVKFHDGSDFNAQVVKWNLETLSAARISTNYNNISSVDVIDDYTVRLNLSAYQNSMLNTLAATMIISKAAFDKVGKEGLRWNPVGTGPFKFVSFERDVVIKFTKFKDYWQSGKPYLDEVQMFFVSDPLTMSAAFQAGEFHAFGGDLSSIHYELQQKGYPIVSAYSGAYCLVPDSKNTESPWSKLEVRLALDYAIDRESLVKARGFGFWTPIYQFANPGTPAYITDLEKRSYNPAKAKELLAKAGYPKGFKTSIYADVASSDKDAITAVQAYMRQVGIDAELSILDFASYGNYRTKGWNNAVLAGMVGFDANLNTSMERYWIKTAAMFPSVAKTDELQNLHLQAMASAEFNPAATQKVIRYLYDNALCAPLWAGSRGDVLQPFVRDTGFYSLQAWPGWKPANTWLDK